MADSNCDSTGKIIEMLDEETLEVLSVNFVTFVQFKKREKHLEGAYSNVTKLSIGVFHVLWFVHMVPNCEKHHIVK